MSETPKGLPVTNEMIANDGDAALARAEMEDPKGMTKWYRDRIASSWRPLRPGASPETESVD